VGDINKCRLVDIPRFQDERGSLSFVEPPLLPFEIRRVYYLYGMPPGVSRGAHGHRRLEQLIIALAGTVDVELDDGFRKQVFSLSRPDRGLYVSPMMWRTLTNFTAGTVCMVLASQRFDESDYFRDYATFVAAVAES
jgi:dTDP-4-dehydrorhamnose 3,5-epimerase-like enzyme